jgi:hypothetical protein
MKCVFCGKEEANHKVKQKTYFGTVSYASEKNEYWYFCNVYCYNKWWTDLTWHLDTLDERMNANMYFKRINGFKGTYKGIPVDASWNGLEARYFGIKDYEFINRRPHPETCKGCTL